MFVFDIIILRFCYETHFFLLTFRALGRLHDDVVILPLPVASFVTPIRSTVLVLSEELKHSNTVLFICRVTPALRQTLVFGVLGARDTLPSEK
jgi:hypothetical protein